MAERRPAAGLGVAAVDLGRAAKVATTEGLPFRAAVPAELGDLRRVLGIVGNDGLDAAVSALLGEAAPSFSEVIPSCDVRDLTVPA